MAATMPTTSVQKLVDESWDALLPTLCDYVRIPAKSPAFDTDWQESGHLERAITLLEQWARSVVPPDATVEVMRLEGRTPLLLVDVPASGATDAGTVLLYGHCDKQPEMHGWRDGLAPWEPIVEGERLFGRGAGDDGYSTFAALTALRAVRDAGGSHARCLALIEASEESGSPDLPAYLDALAERLGDVDLVIGLDAGCSTYDRLWVTTSLRGVLSISLRVDILDEGIHSGASGAVPSSFRIMRMLLSRIEDEATGRVLLDELHVPIPEERQRQAAQAAELIGDDARTSYPFVEGAYPMVDDPTESILARTWRPALSITGVGGIPPLADAGNVLRPHTALQLSMRLPPTCDALRAQQAMVDALTADPPYGAKVRARPSAGVGQGWDAPPTAPWLAASIARASAEYYGNPPGALGLGGTIPFMAMLGERLPDAQFLVVGVMGPASNAHGPNEFLDLPMTRKLTACVASVLHDHSSAKAS